MQMKLLHSILGAVTLVLSFIVMCGVASAHVGPSWNAPSGSHSVDVGYEPNVFKENQTSRFDFIFWEGEVNTSRRAPYDHVLVEISTVDSGVIFSAAIKNNSSGPTTLLYTFDKKGTYSIHTSFRDSDDVEIASGTFPFSVSGVGNAIFSALSVVYAIVGIIIGVLGTCMWMRRASD